MGPTISISCGDSVAHELSPQWTQMSRTLDYFQVRGSSSVIQRRVFSSAEIDCVTPGSNCEEKRRRTTSAADQKRGGGSWLEEVGSISIPTLKHPRWIRIKLNDRVSVAFEHERCSLSVRHRMCRSYICNGEN